MHKLLRILLAATAIGAAAAPAFAQDHRHDDQGQNTQYGQYFGG